MPELANKIFFYLLKIIQIKKVNLVIITNFSSQKINPHTRKLKNNEVQQKISKEVSVTSRNLPEDKDFNAQLTKIKATTPDVLFLPDYYNTVSLIAKQVKQNGIAATMMGADGWDEIANNAGDEVIGSYYSNHYAADAKDTDVETFVKAFKAEYKDQTPNALAALAYDATYILAEAIEKAGSTDPEKIKEA
ncbi:MAG: ABC transporter substrate-binding protein, partial [bacterium]